MRVPAAWLSLLAVGWTPVLGHHSLYGAYERSSDTALEGTVTEFRFVNPHPFLVIEVAGEGGAAETWELEMDNRGELSRLGITVETFAPGDRVVVRGSLALTRDRSLYLWRLDRAADGFWYEQRGSTPYTGSGGPGDGPGDRRSNGRANDR